MELEVALSCPTIGYRVNRGSLALLLLGLGASGMVGEASGTGWHVAWG